MLAYNKRVVRVIQSYYISLWVQIIYVFFSISLTALWQNEIIRKFSPCCTNIDVLLTYFLLVCTHRLHLVCT